MIVYFRYLKFVWRPWYWYQTILFTRFEISLKKNKLIQGAHSFAPYIHAFLKVKMNALTEIVSQLFFSEKQRGFRENCAGNRSTGSVGWQLKLSVFEAYSTQWITNGTNESVMRFRVKFRIKNCDVVVSQFSNPQLGRILMREEIRT